MLILNFGIITAVFIVRNKYIISLKIKCDCIITTATYLYIPSKEFI